MSKVRTIQERRAVRNTQPFIGAMGQLLMISQDGKQVIHTHTLQAVFRPTRGNGAETRLLVQAHVAIRRTLQALGALRAEREGSTVPFTFLAQDLWGKSWSVTKVASQGGAKAGAQQATVVTDGGYQPAWLSLKAGRPVELTFVRKEQSGCGGELRFLSLGLKRSVKPGEKLVVAFTPKR